MLDSQRRQVHKAIVLEYENSLLNLKWTFWHFTGYGGEVDRGCEMLENAALKL